ncbi:MAG: hypothetical protein IH999_11460, partial [Proteobacteria bacterium]|nr:hypothetical protein [Pseudomonadota bacterium]
MVFYRETQASLRIKNIAESLPVLKEISDLNANGDLGQEEAEILRRQILDSTTQFLEAGAVIPEFYEQSTYAPRQLLAPEAKLLAKPQRARKAGSADTNEG